MLPPTPAMPKAGEGWGATSPQCASHCHPNICKPISKLHWQHLPLNFHKYQCDTASFFLAKSPTDTHSMQATTMFFATTVEVSDSSTRGSAAKNPLKSQNKCTPAWQWRMLRQKTGTTEPSPQSRGDHGTFLIIPLQHGGSITRTLVSSQPSRNRP